MSITARVCTLCGKSIVIEKSISACHCPKCGHRILTHSKASQNTKKA